MTEIRATGEEPPDDGPTGVGKPSAGWPVAGQLEQLEQLDPQTVVNAENLGALRFTDADRKLRDVTEILNDLALEEWQELPTDVVCCPRGVCSGRSS